MGKSDAFKNDVEGAHGQYASLFPSLARPHLIYQTCLVGCMKQTKGYSNKDMHSESLRQLIPKTALVLNVVTVPIVCLDILLTL